jgi:hypothetical protein
MGMTLLAMLSIVVAWLSIALAVGLVLGGAVRLRDRMAAPLSAAPQQGADLRLIG